MKHSDPLHIAKNTWVFQLENTTIQETMCKWYVILKHIVLSNAMIHLRVHKIFIHYPIFIQFLHTLKRCNVFFLFNGKHYSITTDQIKNYFLFLSTFMSLVYQGWPNHLQNLMWLSGSIRIFRFSTISGFHRNDALSSLVKVQLFSSQVIEQLTCSCFLLQIPNHQKLTFLLSLWKKFIMKTVLEQPQKVYKVLYLLFGFHLRILVLSISHFQRTPNIGKEFQFQFFPTLVLWRLEGPPSILKWCCSKALTEKSQVSGASLNKAEIFYGYFDILSYPKWILER